MSQSQGVTAVIPARLGSQRFPGKVLYPFQSKPLLFYVWDRVRKCNQIDQLFIATDSKEVATVAKEFGAEVIKTGAGYKTGSDRVAAISDKVGGSVFLNIQADNFALNSKTLDRIISEFKKTRSVEFATMARKIESDDELFDPNKVKVVIDSEKNALWFSRYPLPFVQDKKEGEHWKQHQFLLHQGIYLFRKSGLKKYRKWGRGKLEKAESLEQLRILENSHRVKVFKTNMKMVSVDCKADLDKLDVKRI